MLGDKLSTNAPLRVSKNLEDVTHQTVNSGHAHLNDVGSDDIQDGLSQSFKQDSYDAYHCSGEVDNFLIPSISDGKKLQRKSVKRFNSGPCSKRPRMEQMDNNTNTFINKCTIPDKPGLVKDMKQRVVQDGRKCERKNCRVIGKTKSDSFTWKNGSSNSDFGAGGSSSVGPHGVKIEFHDCTKDMDEPSLSQLLDGSYTCPSLCPSKGKKSSSVNENIVFSVKKACSILPIHGHASNSNKEVSRYDKPSDCSRIVVDLNGTDKVEEDPLSYREMTQDDSLNQVQLHQPSYIMERLALPTMRDLGSLIQDHNLIPMDSLHKACASNVRDPGLPPFSWSFIGSSKPSPDSGKLGVNRYPGQGRWVRIGGYRSTSDENSSCSTEVSALKTFHLFEDPSGQKELDEILSDARKLTTSYCLPLRRLSDSSCETMNASKYGIVEGDIHNVKTDNAFDSSFLDSQVKSTDNCFNGNVKEMPNRGKVAEGSPWHHKNEAEASGLLSTRDSELVRQFTGQETAATEISGSVKGHSHFACPSTKEGRNQHPWQLSTTEVSKADHSPRTVAAAEVLCELARCSKVQKKQNQKNEKIRWPSPPMQVDMKARQAKPPLVKTERLPPESRTTVPPKTAKIPSPQHKSIRTDKKSKFLFAKNSIRESARWPSTSEAMYSPKLERDSSAYIKSSHSNPVKQVDMVMPPPRVEKGRDDHYKGRKEMMSMPSYSKSFGMKDWNRGRSRRE